MKNQSQKIRLGVFLFASLTVLVLVIGLLTAREFFEEEDIYYVSYEGVSVSGLEVGSPVEYMGIKVGSINDITIDPDDVNNIIAELALKRDIPIKEDARANIISMGITGLKAIEISGASNDSKTMEPGSYIRAGSSVMGEITGKAEIIAEKTEQVLNNLIIFSQPENLNKITQLAEDISKLTGQADHTIRVIDTLINENRSDIRNSVKQVKQISDRIDQSSKLLLATMQEINATVKSDTVKEILGNVRDVSLKLKEADVQRLIENIATVAQQTQQLLQKVDSDIDRGSEDFSQSLQLIKVMLENLNEASIKINQDPSILFRGMNTKNIPDHKLND